MGLVGAAVLELRGWWGGENPHISQQETEGRGPSPHPSPPPTPHPSPWLRLRGSPHELLCVRDTASLLGRAVVTWARTSPQRGRGPGPEGGAGGVSRDDAGTLPRAPPLSLRKSDGLRFLLQETPRKSCCARCATRSAPQPPACRSTGRSVRQRLRRGEAFYSRSRGLPWASTLVFLCGRDRAGRGLRHECSLTCATHRRRGRELPKAGLSYWSEPAGMFLERSVLSAESSPTSPSGCWWFRPWQVPTLPGGGGAQHLRGLCGLSMTDR